MAGRNRNGLASATPNERGKSATPLSVRPPIVEFTGLDALQGTVSVTFAGATDAHRPAVARVVPFVDQQEHAVQPAVAAATAVQQQPPRQASVLQSKLLVHASPGEKTTHSPEPKRHAEHPARTAAGVQHAPPTHAPERHVELLAHGSPGPPGSAVHNAGGPRLHANPNAHVHAEDTPPGEVAC